MSGYGKKDAAEDTDTNVGHVSGAWHNANNDAVGTEYEGRPYKKDYANTSDSYYATRDDDEYEEEDSGGGCYIATATLLVSKAPDRTQRLRDLKEWRYKVLERNKLGFILSNVYRHIGPRVAEFVKTKPVLALTLKKGLIDPANWLLTRDSRKQPSVFLRDMGLTVLFCAGLSFGLLVYVFLKKKHTNGIL